MVYLSVARLAFRRATVYRGALLAAIVTNGFFGALLSMVYIAVYQARPSVAGLSLNDVLSYTWATQAMISLGAGWIIHPEIAQAVRNGEVESDLTRPWNLFSYWLARSFGERAFNLLVRVPLTYLVGVVLFGARLPELALVPLILLALFLAMLVSFALSFCVHLCAFWLIDNNGVQMLMNTIISFFSGFLLPIAYFPPVLANIANWLPFQAMAGIPAHLMIGPFEPALAIQSLALQALWALLLCLAALAILHVAVRKIEIQGG